ncbi:MAG: 4Fe-4S dicluster domain-containing protein [Acidobacteriota bacterium]|nr:MAG: 4Fe-4S dicluster domain-containing protein [Acidobacteriota bacterium]
MDRRSFLKVAAVSGTGCLVGMSSEASSTEERPEGYAALVDLTLCEGCRTCEYMCSEANGLPEPDFDFATVDDLHRKTSDKQWVTVNRHQTSKGDVYVRRQCMHCVEPACAAACLTKAMLKTEEGPVIWRADKCMGCRFCMVSCPFDAPKFEYHSAVPKIMKCRMCWERLQDGQRPSCVENCPAEAIVFGKRSELLEIARRRIHTNPDQYVPEIYGEHEAGGTGWLYISPVPFEELGFRTDLGESAYPEYTRDFLTAVPVILTLWPALMLGLHQATRRDVRDEDEDSSATLEG